MGFLYGKSGMDFRPPVDGGLGRPPKSMAGGLGSSAGGLARPPSADGEVLPVPSKRKRPVVVLVAVVVEETIPVEA